MNIPQGPWFIDDLLTFTVVTTVFSTGVATDADAAPAYRVYEDETATPILTGTMALLDSGNTAGFYSEQITLSAANGFEVGKTYSIYVAATVSSVAGATSGGFKVIKKPLSPTVEGRELDVTATGGAGVDWGNVENQSTAVNLSATNIDVDQVVASVTGAVGSVTGNVGGNVTGSVGSVVGAVGSVTGAVGSVTGNVGGNVVGSVGSVLGAVGSVTGAVGSVAGNVGGNVVGSVGSVTAPVTVGTNNDKTDYALSAAGVTAVQSGLATAAALADVPTNAELAAAFDDRGVTEAGGVTRIATVDLQTGGTGGQSVGA